MGMKQWWNGTYRGETHVTVTLCAPIGLALQHPLRSEAND